MEILKINNLTFEYPDSNRVLKNINISINKGEFITVCGRSGCGKTTLLRHLKPALMPTGNLKGEILLNNENILKLSQRDQCQKIGYVQQRPENQIVTDKVWHELAFGLENLGCSTMKIRGKVAEMASFFGIQNWFMKDVNQLSGGQKQLLNLASVMVMEPEILILDEPTAQLDPITASNFLETIYKINKDLGTTVILTEHRLEEAFPKSDRIIVIDDGEVISDTIPEKTAVNLTENEMFKALPTPARIYFEITNDDNCPITIKDGRSWLEALNITNNIVLKEKPTEAKTLIEIKNLWYRYEKNSPDIIKGLNLEIKKGESIGILGGNGTGKTTLINLICGLLKPYSGKVLINNKNISKIENKYKGLFGVLPQDPQSIFSHSDSYSELAEIKNDEKSILDIAYLCNIRHLLKSHPYDLSGGEQQRLALAKILLLEPEILVLDEPTKGFDSSFKEEFGGILSKLNNRGTTVIIVSHDIEFCAKYTLRCALMFNGEITAMDTPAEFFGGNSFYTTSASRMSRGILKNAVLDTDIIEAIKGDVKNEKI